MTVWDGTKGATCDVRLHLGQSSWSLLSICSCQGETDSKTLSRCFTRARTWLIWHHLTSSHTCLGSVYEIVLLIFSKPPAFKPTSSSPPLPMEPLEIREKQRWFMCLPAAWVGFLSARNRKQQEASLVLLNYLYEEREKHHVESVQVLQPHTSGWIPLLPCSLQVCLHYYFINSSASC